MYLSCTLTCRIWSFRLAVFASVLAMLQISTGFASEVFNTGGFESYSLGNLVGQSQSVSPATPRSWVTAGHGGSSAVVASTVGVSGSQGVEVNRGANSDDRWAVPVGGLGYPSNGHVFVDWDMKVTATGSTSAFGPFLGVDTYDDTSGPRVLGSLGVDATTGDVLYQLQGSGVLAETGAKVTFDQWHHFQIRLDFVQDNYQVFVDGIQRGSQEGFVDGTSSTFTDADIAAFAAAFDATSQSQTATAFFDNFIVRDILPGDFDEDGDVDGNDFLTWQRGGSPSPLSAADLTDWQNNYGNFPLVASATAVPEPTAGSLVWLAVLCLFGQRRTTILALLRVA